MVCDCASYCLVVVIVCLWVVSVGVFLCCLVLDWLFYWGFA